MNILAIAVFGAIGGVLRLLLENSIHMSGGFPLATLAINLIGSFALGFFYIMAEQREWKIWLRSGIGTGLIGSFTTFSTFSLNVIQLAQTSLAIATIYLLSSILGGLLCAYLGDLSGKWIYGSEMVTETAEIKEVYP